MIHTETIDFGVMEKASRVAVIPARDLQWNDVGSWESLFDVMQGDEYGNIIIGGEHIGVDTRDLAGRLGECRIEQRRELGRLPQSVAGASG